MGESYGKKIATEIALRILGYSDEGLDNYWAYQDQVQAERDALVQDYVQITKDYVELTEDSSFADGLQLVGAMTSAYDSSGGSSGVSGTSMSGGGGSWESSGGGGVFDYSGSTSTSLKDAAEEGAYQAAKYGAGKALDSYAEYQDEMNAREQEMRNSGMSSSQAKLALKSQMEKEAREKALERNAKLKSAANTAKEVNNQIKQIQSIGAKQLGNISKFFK